MTAARIYLGALLALMAIGQLASFGTFADVIEDYDVAVAPVLAAVLVALELMAATGLLAPVPAAPRRVAAWLGVATAVLWSLLALEASRAIWTSTTAAASGASSASP